MQYQLGGRKGRTRRVTISAGMGSWTPAAARVEANACLGRLPLGVIPQTKLQ